MFSIRVSTSVTLLASRWMWKIRVLVLNSNKFRGLAYPVADFCPLSVTPHPPQAQTEHCSAEFGVSHIVSMKNFCFLEVQLVSVTIEQDWALGGCVYSLEFGRFWGSCCIPLDVHSFAQRMFSIPNWIWGFARGGNRGRNQLLGLDLLGSDGSELLSALPSREQELVQEGSALDLAAAGECARDVWECWSLVTGLTAIVCSMPAALP